MLKEVQTENIDVVASPYSMFKYSIRTELTRKYYERRISTFFDLIEFMVGSPIEVRCNLFAEKAKSDTHRAIVHIISFLQYEKERVQKEEITAIKDAENAKKRYLVEIWQKIKDDKLNHLGMLKDALEKEIHGQ